MKKLLILIFTLTGMLLLGLNVAPARAFAAAVRPLESFCTETGGQGEVCDLDRQDKAESDTDLLSQDGIVKKVFDLVSWLTGLLAGVFIIVGGFRLITSGGNKDTVKSTRNTVIYAAVGLAVIILANLIINVVVGLSNKASN